MNVAFLNNYVEVNTLLAYKVTSSNTTNSVYVHFHNDDEARDFEAILKQHGYKTSHTDKTICVYNFNSFDLILC